MNLFILREPDPPWGDYGHILIHGLASHAGDEADGLLLERTGPFVPPVSFPGREVVVTDSVRGRLESAFDSLSFRPVVMKRIVRLDWRSWDLAADNPRFYPAGGEPENYILGRKQDERLAEAMAPLWQVVVAERPGIQIEGTKQVDVAKYGGEDLLRASRSGGYLYVSARLKDWLEVHEPEWVAFEVAAAA